MNPRRPRAIPLYANPPSPTRDKLPADEDSSDFPPMRICDTTPEPHVQSPPKHSRYRPSAVKKNSEHRSSPSQSPVPRLPKRSRSSNRAALGHKNIVNTIEVTVQSDNLLKPSSKRRRLESSVDTDHRSKKQHLELKDEVDWMKAEISDIKTCMRDIKLCMREIAEHLRGDVDFKLEEIIDRIQRLDLCQAP